MYRIHIAALLVVACFLVFAGDTELDAAKQKSAECKAAAEKALPFYRTAHQKYVAWLKNNPSQRSAPPRSIIDPLNQNFDAWIAADQRYVSALFDEQNRHAEDSAERRKLCEAAAAHCSERINNEVLIDFPVITAWYSYMQGRFFAALDQDEKALVAWSDVDLPLTELPRTSHLAYERIQQQILREHVELLFKRAKYERVVALLEENSGPHWFLFHREDLRDALKVHYARALVLRSDATREDYSAALALLAVGAKGEFKNQNARFWTFCRTMSEIAKRADNRKLDLSLSSPECFFIARGFAAQAFQTLGE